MIREKAFAGLSIMTVADLLQVPRVRGKLIFSRFCDKYSREHLLALQLWHIFKYAELTEVVKQNDKLVVDLLYKVRVGKINDDVEKLIKAIFTHEYDGNYLNNASYIYAEN